MSTQDDSIRNPASESIPEAPDAAEIEQPSNPAGPADTDSTKPKEAALSKSATPRPTPTASRVAAKPVAPKKEPSSRTVTKPVASTRATGGTAATKRPAPVKTAANETGFVKPKPKSPTKPVNLPSSLTAPTAASAHKGGASRQPNLTHSASATASKPVKRENLVASRPRPSLGAPPVSKVSQESTSSKRQSHVDEGFLARMMRPTAASSSKTIEKGAPPTPPKKTAPRISNVGAETGRRMSKSPVPNRAASAARPREATSRAEKSLKPATAKTVAKAAAVPAAAAVVATKVLPDSTASKLADRLPNLGTGEPEEDLEQETTNEPEIEPAPVAELDSEVDQHPENETELEAEPEVEDVVEATVAEEAEAEVEHAAEKETLEEPQEHVEEAETVEDAHPEVENENEIISIEHIKEPEPASQEEDEDSIEAHAQGELHADEEAVTLEDAALEAAQVETAEEAIEIAEEAEPKHLASFDDVTKTAEPVIGHSTIKEGAVSNGFANNHETESASALPQATETSPQHADKAAADETVIKDGDATA